jgi:hypothetical protein
LYLRFMLMRGTLHHDSHAVEVARVRERLAALTGAHWQAYLTGWR